VLWPCQVTPASRERVALPPDGRPRGRFRCPEESYRHLFPTLAFYLPNCSLKPAACGERGHAGERPRWHAAA